MSTQEHLWVGSLLLLIGLDGKDSSSFLTTVLATIGTSRSVF